MTPNPLTTEPPATASVFKGGPVEVTSVLGEGIVTTMTHSVSKADKFDPEVVEANEGDKILFRFYPSNHSVVRGTYDNPCIPYDTIYPRVDKIGAIWSGWQPVPMIKQDNEMPSFIYTVRSTDQLFLYCSAPGSCNKNGMVMIINPNGSVPLEVYRQEAFKSPYSLTPGEPYPDGENRFNPPPSIRASRTISETPTGDPASSNGPPQNRELAGIAGIVIGGIGAIALLGLLFYFILRRRRHSRQRETTHRHTMDGAPPYLTGIHGSHQGMNTSGHPYYHPNGSMTLSRSPTSPVMSSHHYSNSNGTNGHPQTRETVIIPITEEEKAMYLDRIQGVPIQTSSAQDDRHPRSISPVSPGSTHIRNGIGRSSSGSANGIQTSIDTYGSWQRPAEMPADDKDGHAELEDPSGREFPVGR